ncbi:vacuole protein [Penicillium sp. IBT 35674x]|nr:vacuole protein [Penicillium sp. IBT 35674x]
MRLTKFPLPFILASTLAATATGFGWEWQTCSSEDEALSIRDVKLSPDPPLPGGSVNITLEGILQETIEDGSLMRTTLKIGSVLIQKREIDICGDFLNGTGISCPVPPGPFHLTKSYDPENYAEAAFKLEAHAYNADESEITCLRFSIDTRRRFELRNKE